MNYQVKNRYFDQMFKQFDKDNSGYIEFNEFELMLHNLRQHVELKEIFNKYKNPVSGLMTPDQVKKFLEIE